MKRILKIVILLILLIFVGLTGYWFYSSWKINELSTMTFEEMLFYTTKNNKEAMITVGIIQDGTMSYNVYGENGSMLLQENHTYEVGSITKTFTTSLLCKALSEDKISLEEKINTYLFLKDKGNYPTIKQLVTHTSGYKAFYFEKPMISNFLKGRNDFYGISEEMLIERIEKVDVDVSNYSFEYSNFGLAALGLVLEKVYGEDYRKLINTYISEELGLKDTKVSDGTGDLGNYWEWSESDVYIPAGALVSNISDMMQYVYLQMNETEEYLQIAHEPLANVDTVGSSNEKLGIYIDSVATGWMIDSKNNIIWHNGGTKNYNSYIGFDKENQIGVVVLSNLPPDYRIPATIMGVELLKNCRSR